MTSFEPHKVRKVAAAFGAILHGVAGLATVALVVLGWFTVGSGLLASALFLSLAALHIWGLAQFGTLRLSSTGLELDRWHPAVFTWEEVRLVGEDRRRLVLQTPAGRLTLYPTAFANAEAVRQAVLARLRAGRTA